jgi:hypothetical protein
MAQSYSERNWLGNKNFLDNNDIFTTISVAPWCDLI